MIQYTAQRSLVSGHAAGMPYVLDLPLMDCLRGRNVQKNVVRASAGLTETLYHHADTEWTLTFAPVDARDFDLLKEFLDSTASGETFLVWLYGDESAPITVMRADEGYDPAIFMRTGRRQTDLHTVSITVREEP